MNFSDVKKCPDFENPNKKTKFWEETHFLGVQKLSRNGAVVWGESCGVTSSVLMIVNKQFESKQSQYTVHPNRSTKQTNTSSKYV